LAGRETKPRASDWINFGSSIYFGSRRPLASKSRKFLPMYVRLFEKLLSENVEFLLLGGAAVCLHGYSRMTTDIDIILQNSPENISRFLSAVSHWVPAARWV